jgi:1-acyl-sn-glycerol-3-phosphate acyltransferase
MIYLRSLLFDIFFYSFSILYTIFLWPFMLFMREKNVFLIYTQWSKIVIFLLKKIMNINVVINGSKNIPSTPCIIAFQHQSAFDTIIPPLMFNNFIFALKKELFYVPFLGHYLCKLNAIFLDRKKGVSSLRHLLIAAQKAHKKGKSILIYPQGSRISPAIKAPMQPGIYGLYKHLNTIILPVSIDSGYVWKRRSFFKSSGIIKIVIHPAIEKKIPKDQVMKKLEDIFYSNLPIP